MGSATPRTCWPNSVKSLAPGSGPVVVRRIGKKLGLTWFQELTGLPAANIDRSWS